MEKPKNLAEAVDQINSKFDGMERYFVENDENTFASFCHSQLSGGIGMKIRNHFEFWSDQTTPLYLDLKNNHHCIDPDAMSDKIIRGIYKLRKNQITMPYDQNEFKNNAFSEAISKNQPDKGDFEKFKKLSTNLTTLPNSPDVQSKMPSYIGTKVVCATPMSECAFLSNIKGQEVGDREDMNGYLVVYEDGYKSWSPKEVFERSYRLITAAEKRLI